MKKMIKNKLYDTETAKEVGSTSAELNPFDFGYWSQTLYRKKTGEYFLYGEGGPMSRYAKSRGQNEWSGGEKIDPMSYEAAKDWAEENLSADAYQKEFGEVFEDDSITHLGLTVTADVAAMARKASIARGISISEYISELVRAADNA